MADQEERREEGGVGAGRLYRSPRRSPADVDVYVEVRWKMGDGTNSRMILEIEVDAGSILPA